jgi:signal transduction histidine kinase
MKRKRSLLAGHYQAALRQHLTDGAESDLTAAHRLGQQAVKLGLETLDLAKIHEEALLAVMLPKHDSHAGEDVVRRCVAFFAEAALPVEETHRGVQEAGEHLKVMLATLTERTVELAKSNEELQREIVIRRSVEDSLRISELTTSQLLKKSRQMQDELRQLSRRLIMAQEEERRRISRDLHDVIAQSLTGINLRLSALKTQTMEDARDLHKKIAATQRLVEKSVAIVHRFARDLRPALLDDLGLIPALEVYLKGFMEETGIRASLRAFAGLEKLRSETRTVLYRVVQEALVNVSKHAKASEVKVHLHDEAGTICLDIIDNGRGFAVEGVRQGRGSKRLGLLGMRERVAMVGGSLAVESAPGASTSLHIRIPPRGRRSPLVPEKTAKPQPSTPLEIDL